MAKRLADDVPAFENLFFLSKTSKRVQSITRALPSKIWEVKLIRQCQILLNEMQ